MKAEILYKGSVIGTISNGETITLHCADKVLTDDVVVRAAADVSIISFTVDGITYQAEEGMTWYEWGLSDYYTDDNWAVPDTGIVYGPKTKPLFEGEGYTSSDLESNSSALVKGDELIIANHDYYSMTGSF